MSKYPEIIITEQMISKATELIDQVKVNRTIASKIDTLTGNLGEFVFAQYFYKDWRKNRVGNNKGDVNFVDIEIKTSSFPFSEKLNLLVREDYAKKRKPPFYIQIIIDVASYKSNVILPNTKAYICGYASARDVDKSPLRDFGSKLSSKGGYKCHYISIKKLKSMDSFADAYKRRNIEK